MIRFEWKLLFFQLLKNCWWTLKQNKIKSLFFSCFVINYVSINILFNVFMFVTHEFILNNIYFNIFLIRLISFEIWSSVLLIKQTNIVFSKLSKSEYEYWCHCDVKTQFVFRRIWFYRNDIRWTFSSLSRVGFIPYNINVYNRIEKFSRRKKWFFQ